MDWFGVEEAAYRDVSGGGREMGELVGCQQRSLGTELLRAAQLKGRDRYEQAHCTSPTPL